MLEGESLGTESSGWTQELKGPALSWPLSHSQHRFFCFAGLLQEREGASGDGTWSRSPAGLGALPDAVSPFPARAERDGEGAWARGVAWSCALLSLREVPCSSEGLVSLTVLLLWADFGSKGNWVLGHEFSIASIRVC